MISLSCLDIKRNDTQSNDSNEQKIALKLETSIDGKFAPPEGQILFIVGQDNETISEYLAAVPAPHPGGVTSYTSLNKLEGTTSLTNYGSGDIFLTQLAGEHPDSVVVLGLSVVSYLSAVPTGQADHKINRLLDFLIALDRPVFLRFGYEFDGEWNHYDPEEYKAAWIYFREKIRDKKADNIVMVWQGATCCGGTYQGHPVLSWYPGDKHVDWMGISYFTQADCDFQPIHDFLEIARSHQKPVMIAESAPQRYETGKLTFSRDGNVFQDRIADEIWQEWYLPYFTFIKENADVVRATAYINTYWDSQQMWGPPYPNGYWGDSRVQANQEILRFWLVELGDPVWLMASPDLFSILGDS